MTKGIFVVRTNAVDGREDEFNDWYTNQHLSDVLAVPGIVSAQRFQIADIYADAADFTYLALYEFEGEPAEVRAALRMAVSDGMYVSDAAEPSNSAVLFTAISSRLSSQP